MSAATASSRSRRLPTSATSSPGRRGAGPSTSPMPEPAPVTMATRSSKLYDDTTTRARGDHRRGPDGRPDRMRVRARRSRRALARSRPDAVRSSASTTGSRCSKHTGSALAETVRAAAGRVSSYADPGEAASDATLLVESLPEDLELKTSVARRALRGGTGRDRRDEHLVALDLRDRRGDRRARAHGRHALPQPSAADADRRGDRR